MSRLQLTGHLRYLERRESFKNSDGYDEIRMTKTLQQQWGYLNGWAWSGQEWKDVPIVKEVTDEL